jgi:aminoglycoside phosphotransferase family enzyme/predicted kinase
MGSLREDLAGPGIEVVETHISWVFLAEYDVWKVKKPVSLAFLDFSTEEKRRVACEAEVDLNRPWAPDAYHGVVPITLDSSGRHRFGGSGAPVDWAVHMVRLPEGDRADARTRDGRLTASDLGRVAERVAAFHERSRCDEETARFGALEEITRNVRDNFEQGRGAACDYLGQTEAAALEARQLGFLSDHSALFEDRVRGGRVREGHGDLRLEHIYLDDEGGVRVLDCIEFNDRFRFLDVCSDVAFLSMDLAYQGRGDLAEHFLAEYARMSNDYDLYPIVGFYESYRAYVRAMVNAILAEDGGASALVRERSAEAARRHYLLARDSLPAQGAEGRSVVLPMVLAVGGIVASGKTTVALRAGSEMMAPVVGSDRTRKWLLGADPTTSVGTAPWTDAYSTETTERVYDEVFRRARSVLQSNRPVVIDASFRSLAHREAARRLALEAGVPFLFVECRIPSEVSRERLLRRDREPSVSDARVALLDDFVASWEPVDELEPAEHLVLDTSGSIEENVESLQSCLLKRRRAPTPSPTSSSRSPDAPSSSAT